MGSATSAVTPGTKMHEDAANKAAELGRAIDRSREEIGQTLEALHGKLNPRVMKEELLQQYQEGKQALKADLQAEFHAAKATLAAEYQDIKQQAFTGVKTEVSDAKAALRDATIGKVETMLHDTKETVRDASHSLVSTVKSNPIPAALVGVGLIWMISNSRSRQRSMPFGDHDDRVPGHSPASRIATGLSRAAHQAADKVGDVAHSAGETLGDAASSVKESVGAAARATSREFSNLAHSAGSAGERLGRRSEVMYFENPLAVGAAVLVAGALVGMAIPITRKETALMGEAQRDFVDRAGHLAEKVGAQLHDGAERVTGELKKAMDQTTQHAGADRSNGS